MGFRLEINSLDDFVKFVAFIKGDNLDIEGLKKFTAELNESSSILDKAVKQGEENAITGSSRSSSGS